MNDDKEGEYDQYYAYIPLIAANISKKHNNSYSLLSIVQGI
jgi:hypothetical protein